MRDQQIAHAPADQETDGNVPDVDSHMVASLGAEVSKVLRTVATKCGLLLDPPSLSGESFTAGEIVI